MRIKCCVLLLFFFASNVNAQKQDTINAKYFSVGSKHIGICFGNSSDYTGLRFNLIDKGVCKVNILNFSLLLSRVQESNGISLSLFFNNDDVNNGFSYASIGNGGYKRSGLVISGLINNSKIINGVGIAGLGVIGDTLCGFFITSIKIGSWSTSWETKQINGVAICFGTVMADEVNGLTLAGVNRSMEHHGLSIGLFNRTEKLRGVQIGLINYAGNNPRGLRWLPLINMHFDNRTKAP